jgi:hypothetical protein
LQKWEQIPSNPRAHAPGLASFVSVLRVWLSQRVGAGVLSVDHWAKSAERDFQ